MAIPRPRTMPPRLASKLTPGFNVPLSTESRLLRARQIAQGTYPPYALLWAFLRPFGPPTIRDIARLSGLRVPLVSRYLRGVSEPHFYAGMKMARAIGCTPDALDAYLAQVQRSPLIPVERAIALSIAREAKKWKEGMTQEIPAPLSPPSHAR